MDEPEDEEVAKPVSDDIWSDPFLTFMEWASDIAACAALGEESKG